ncbi:hypothetical protein [Curtobacterium sp. MCBD17_040]|uniref:hypothetical protein n=1 Tax=Curtobacterium sp. MCBD17_040 TaxID=2175674 RepID=UPI000DA76C05|nr:hypothetical protein [Curtobacterium sp. MCBD17_040]WIB65560.1 hypothetical protein DEI94_19490 [Curtobacterium sp. MCBD17_040]
MSNQQPRTFAEKTRPWLAGIWLLLGALWLVDAVLTPTIFHIVEASFWLVGGGVYVTVALLERKKSGRRQEAPAAHETRAQREPQ